MTRGLAGGDPNVELRQYPGVPFTAPGAKASSHSTRIILLPPRICGSPHELGPGGTHCATCLYQTTLVDVFKMEGYFRHSD